MNKSLRSIRVFVSSTFSDMMEERSQLALNTFPQLQHWCEQRNVSFRVVDLRWGITSEEVASGKTLSLCLDEIDQCRPYFIGILGERYGWHSGSNTSNALFKKTFEAAKERHVWLEKYSDRSITELEMLYGALKTPSQQKHQQRCFFYFRDPNYIDTLPIGSEQRKNVECESELAGKKLKELKNSIRQSKFPLRENYQNPNTLAQLILHDLTESISNDFPVTNRKSEDEETEVHESFGLSRASLPFVGRETQINQIQQHINNSTSTTPLVVVGESGIGKTSLLSNTFSYLKRVKKDDSLLFVHFVGSTLDSGNHFTVMRRLIEKTKAFFQLPLDIPEGDEALESQFQTWFQACASKYQQSNLTSPKRVVMILDGVEHLFDSVAQELHWLPNEFPPCFRIVLSCSSSSSTFSAILKKNWPLLKLEGLGTIETQTSLIKEYLNYHSKKLSAQHIDAILRRNQAFHKREDIAISPIYLITFLDYLTHHVTHDELNLAIEMLVKNTTGPQGEGDVLLLFQQLLKKWEESFEGEEWSLVKKLLSSVWCSHYGMMEQEWIECFRIPSQSVLSPLYVAAARYFFVKPRGLHTFLYEHFQQAVEKKYLATEEEKKRMYIHLANYFERLSDNNARKLEELPYLLMKAGNTERLQAFLTNIPNFVAIYNSPHKLHLVQYWQFLQGSSRKQKDYAEVVASYLKSLSTLPPNQKNDLHSLRSLAKFFEEVGQYEASSKLLLQIVEQGLDQSSRDDIHNLASLYIRLARYKEAEAAIKKCLAIDEKTENSPQKYIRLAKDYQIFGLIKKKTGNYQEAGQLLEIALGTLRNKAQSTPSISLCLSELLNSKSDVERKLGHYAEASTLYQTSLEITEKVLGSTHPALADILKNLGLVEKKLGRYAQAQEKYKQALQLIDACFGKNHPSYAMFLNDLGDVYRKMGEFERAFDFYCKSLLLNEKLLGPDHPEVAETLNSLGMLLKKKACYDEAATYYERALGIIEKSFDQSHPKVAQYTNNVADIKRKIGEFEEALILYKRSLAILEKSFGPDHGELAEVLNNIGLVHKKRGEYTAARTCYDRALEIIRKEFGDNHSKYALCLHNLGDVYRKEKQNEKALATYELARSILKENLGATHPEVADVLHNIALIKIAQRQGEAEALLNEALEIVKQQLGPKHPKIGFYLNSLGEHFRLSKGSMIQAERCYTEALDLVERSLGKNHPEVADILLNFGVFKLQMKQPEVAKTAWLRAVSIIVKSFGDGHYKFAELQKHLKRVGVDIKPTGRKRQANPEASNLLKKHLLLKQQQQQKKGSHPPQVQRGAYKSGGKPAIKRAPGVHHKTTAKNQHAQLSPVVALWLTGLYVPGHS